MAIFSSFKRKGGGALTQKVTADLAKQSTNSGATELGDTSFLNARNGGTSAVGSGPSVAFSSATYQARDPCGDSLILESNTSGAQPHVFAAVLTSERTAHGGEHLRRHLYKEVLQQLKITRGDPMAALKAALVALDLKFRSLHLYNANVLAGTQITAAFLDLASNQLHLISNGGARAVVASRSASTPDVIVELGRPLPAVTSSPPAAAGGLYSGGPRSAGVSPLSSSRDVSDSSESQPSIPASSSAPALGQLQRSAAEAAAQPPRMAEGARLLPAGTATVQLTEDVESIILGSPGLWHELSADQAALRAQAMVESAPHATGGNVAAHLAQLALQAVAARSSRQVSDPRMASLRSTASLQQLWTGSRANYRWGGRQPLRRRRGDVHGDLTALVMRLDWDGGETLRPGSLQAKLRRIGSGGQLLKPASLGSFGTLRSKGTASHWDLVRMHFLGYLPAARAAARSRWYAAVDVALVVSAAERAAARAAAAAATAEADAAAVVESAAAVVAEPKPLPASATEPETEPFPEADQQVRAPAASLAEQAEPRPARVLVSPLVEGQTAPAVLVRTPSLPAPSAATSAVPISVFASAAASSKPAAPKQAIRLTAVAVGSSIERASSVPTAAPGFLAASKQLLSRVGDVGVQRHSSASEVDTPPPQKQAAADATASMRRALGGVSRRNLMRSGGTQGFSKLRLSGERPADASKILQALAVF